MKKLTAENLKGLLWETLQKLKAKKIEPQVADAVASQSREIVRVIKSQQSILHFAHQKCTDELIRYAK